MSLDQLNRTGRKRDKRLLVVKKRPRIYHVRYGSSRVTKLLLSAQAIEVCDKWGSDTCGARKQQSAGIVLHITTFVTRSCKRKWTWWLSLHNIASRERTFCVCWPEPTFLRRLLVVRCISVPIWFSIYQNSHEKVWISSRRLLFLYIVRNAIVGARLYLAQIHNDKKSGR